MTFSAYYVFFISRKVKTPTEMPKKKKKKICAVCGGGVVTDRTHQKCFVKFHAGDFWLDDDVP